MKKIIKKIKQLSFDEIIIYSLVVAKTITLLVIIILVIFKLK